jgi:ADP-ribosyl-[dinitrogen reductase] hydrolase
VIGKVGLTFAPGKRQDDGMTGAWNRDLAADVTRLRMEFDVAHLVCLLEGDELRELEISALPEEAVASGMAFHRLPLPDGAVPGPQDDVAGLISQIAGWAAAGENVVIHCKGGLGRAGTIGGCVKRAAGKEGDAALGTLANARGPACPETPEQRRYVRDFVPRGPSGRSRVLGTIMGAAIGDALGHPTEFLSVEGIRRQFGNNGVTGFELWWQRDGERFAPYTDDTQMAEIVLRSLVRARRTNAPMEWAMREIAAGFAE